MDFIEKLFKWVLGLALLTFVFYTLFLVVNQKIQEKEYKRTHFKCTYIEGMCNKKPTWKNCQMYGEIPVHLCEKKLNRK